MLKQAMVSLVLIFAIAPEVADACPSGWLPYRGKCIPLFLFHYHTYKASPKPGASAAPAVRSHAPTPELAAPAPPPPSAPSAVTRSIAPVPAIVAPAFVAPTAPAAVAKPATILETGYDVLPVLGEEIGGYGLYSYAILTSQSNRSSQFLGEVIKSIPAIQETAADAKRLNVFYIPIKKDQKTQFKKEISTAPVNFSAVATDLGTSFYDFRMARAILDHLCGLPPDTMRDLCHTDLSRGPYIFTYAIPASRLETVPPPYLFVDLSDVDSRAFAELLSAFREQVKRDDVTDRARIDTLRLKLLKITFRASDWIGQIKKEGPLVSDIVHPAIAAPDK